MSSDGQWVRGQGGDAPGGVRFAAERYQLRITLVNYLIPQVITAILADRLPSVRHLVLS